MIGLAQGLSAYLVINFPILHHLFIYKHTNGVLWAYEKTQTHIKFTNFVMLECAD